MLTPVVPARKPRLIGRSSNARGFRVARELGRNDPLLSAIVTTSTDAIIVTGGSGQIVLFNPSAERMFCCSSAYAAGKPLDRFILVPRSARAFPGSSARVVAQATRANGEAFAPEAAITKVDVGGRRLCTVLISERATDAPLQQQNERLERQAQRIARALHDEAGQFLTAAHIALAQAVRRVPPAVRPALHDVTRHLDGIEEQLRRIAHEIGPRVLDDMGLSTAVQFLAAGFAKRRGVSVTVAAATAPLPPTVQTTIYRFVQEALTNVGRHARAHQVTVRVEQKCGIVQCTVNDDGVGFDSRTRSALETQGTGLRSIRESVASLGGTFQIRSTPGFGARVMIRLPVTT